MTDTLITIAATATARLWSAQAVLGQSDWSATSTRITVEIVRWDHPQPVEEKQDQFGKLQRRSRDG